MIYNDREIGMIKESCRRLAAVLAEVIDMVKPGATTEELDVFAEKKIRELGATPAFLGYRGNLSKIKFPSTLCTSINNEVVHGPATPSRDLKDGDIIGLDVGLKYNGFYSDMAATVGVGKISPEASKLINVTKEALSRGIAAAQVGNTIRDIGYSVQSYVEKEGFSVVRDLVGHGVGASIHEEPEVPNFAVKGPVGDKKIMSGLVIAIEPMVAAGRYEVITGADGWTIETKDNSLAAHFEHTIAVTKKGPEILTKIN